MIYIKCKNLIIFYFFFKIFFCFTLFIWTFAWQCSIRYLTTSILLFWIKMYWSHSIIIFRFSFGMTVFNKISKLHTENLLLNAVNNINQGIESDIEGQDPLDLFWWNGRRKRWRRVSLTTDELLVKIGKRSSLIFFFNVFFLGLRSLFFVFAI